LPRRLMVLRGPDADDELARAIVAAHDARHCLTSPHLGVVLSDSRAYRVQRRVTQERIDRGERVAGWKLGYTSTAMREQMGIAEPNFGPLTDRMLLGDDQDIPDTVTQPRVEPEIALVLAADVTRRIDLPAVRGAVATAHAALEIVDSVWSGYRFTWAENTADGSSAAYVVMGPALNFPDLRTVEVDLTVNAVRWGSGTGEAAMGDPFRALEWLAGQLIDEGRGLRAGDVVITGGLTTAAPLVPGDEVRADFSGVSVRTRWPLAGDEPVEDGSLVR
jgi:2-keto-4-pentenoate hydratase